jgi:hypothetical protein
MEKKSVSWGKLLRRVVLGIIGIALLAFLAIQLVPVDRSNPPVVSEPNWDSPETRALAQRACFDCHSNETKWPWYSYVAPVSWTVARDVQAGRQVLNFSDWANVRGEARSAGEMAEAIGGGYMPPSIYTRQHPEAVLSAEERQALIDGLRATVGQSQ